MLKKLCLIGLLLSFAFSGLAHAGLEPINDSLDIDYSTNTIQVFVVLSGKREYMVHGAGFYTPAQKKAREEIYNFVSNMIVGKGETKVKDELKKRPALDAKVRNLIDKHKKAGEDQVLADTQTHTIYYTFDLGLIKQLLPEIVFPEKD